MKSNFRKSVAHEKWEKNWEVMMEVLDLLKSSILSWTFLVFLSKVWCIWTDDLEDHTKLSFAQKLSVFPNSDVGTLFLLHVDQRNWSFRTLFLPHGRVSYYHYCYYYFFLLLFIIISEHCFSTMDELRRMMSEPL